MSSSLKPLILWGDGGINPTKVAIILYELKLPFNTEKVLLADIKKPEYTAINPNGRLPALRDPNTGITLWESGAIIEYLIERYDTEHKLSFERDTPEYYQTKQWLHFQMSGQGPYYGQASWFKMFHKEPIPSAIERYIGEVKRVSGVLNTFLEKQAKEAGSSDGPWLVGQKVTYADLAFLPWQWLIKVALTKEEYDAEEYPALKNWLDRMEAREGVKSGQAVMKRLD
ncbi:unnamed protein product [Clonostachys rosea]|uniref:Glutathione S-transferase n=1 Tax=Bionectria ochroleuca TaxID=29856 RepID=A0ABY6TZB4_BIOOC|nr:unnamed protein product [Clonostachys rosea]